MPLVSYFGDKLGSQDLSDEMILSCFMIVALSSFMAPNSSMKPSTKYLSALQDTNNVAGYDWSKFVYDWLMRAIRKFNNKSKATGKKCKILGGCIYFIAVYYLDFVNFGVHFVPRGVPRINVWKGDIIKLYSKSDQVDSRSFGKRPIKDLSKTCYSKIGFISQNFCSGQLNSPCFNISEFKEKLETSFGHCLPIEVKDVFYDILNGSSSISCISCNYKADILILRVLQILSDAASNKPDPDCENNNHSLELDAKSKTDQFHFGAPPNNIVPSNEVLNVGGQGNRGCHAR
uniref:Aminotransferase-like plant mobile domain-containing protein n=1 Tax=Arundo donax TaxID=35708 RepID=A0A0A9C1Y0_ARUDO